MELLKKPGMMNAGPPYNTLWRWASPVSKTPGAIKKAAVAALNEGKTFYTHSLGIPELRQAISDDYASSCHVDIPPDRIIVTNGSSGAFTLIFMALLEPGRTLVLC